jgi:hypothetical protein
MLGANTTGARVPARRARAGRSRCRARESEHGIGAGRKHQHQLGRLGQVGVGHAEAVPPLDGPCHTSAPSAASAWGVMKRRAERVRMTSICAAKSCAIRWMAGARKAACTAPVTPRTSRRQGRLPLAARRPSDAAADPGSSSGAPWRTSVSLSRTSRSCSRAGRRDRPPGEPPACCRDRNGEQLPERGHRGGGNGRRADRRFVGERPQGAAPGGDDDRSRVAGVMALGIERHLGQWEGGAGGPRCPGVGSW